MDELKKQEEMKKKYYHNNEYYEKKIYICQIDSVKFFNEDDYLEHYDEEHPDTYPFYCELCKRGFNHEKALISHINTSFKHKKRIKYLIYIVKYVIKNSSLKKI